MSFGTMPFLWITDGRLKEFSARPGVTGRSIAALKCYLAIAAYRDFRDGTSTLSMYDLCELCGLTKPTIGEGLAMLEAFELVDIETRGGANGANRYSLTGIEPESRNFRKVPQDQIARSLPVLSNRGPKFLHALKLYVAMLYLRNEESNVATVSHDGLNRYTGVDRAGIATGNSIVHSAGLALVRYAENDWNQKELGHPINAYHLYGDFDGRRRFLRRPSETRRVPPWTK